MSGSPFEVASPSSFAVVHAKLRDKAQALVWLESARGAAGLRRGRDGPGRQDLRRDGGRRDRSVFEKFDELGTRIAMMLTQVRFQLLSLPVR